MLELLRRKNLGSEAGRKKLFTNARLLEAQEMERAIKGQSIIGSTNSRLLEAQELERAIKWLSTIGMHTIVEVEIISEVYQPRPFAETHLGKLPPELRTPIYHELVATPPEHVGQKLTIQGIRAGKQNPNGPATLTTTFVHLQASCLVVLKTCRQIYVEAHPVFYARTSYYIGNTQEFSQLMRLTKSCFFHPTLRCSTVTSLCVKDLVVWKNFLGQSQCSVDLNVRAICCTQLAVFESLRKVHICLRVGEELGYIDFLFGLPRMSRGVIEFMDESHWKLRLQRPEENWNIQYACFATENYRKGKRDLELSNDETEIQRQLLKIDSRAPGLEEGQEHIVEVNIDAPLEKRMPWKMEAMMDKFGGLSIG